VALILAMFGAGILAVLLSVVLIALEVRTSQRAVAFEVLRVLRIAGDPVSDRLRTAIEPSWDEIGRLAAIAAIRTGLNYFLQTEIAEDARVVRSYPEGMQIVLGSALPGNAQTRSPL